MSSLAATRAERARRSTERMNRLLSVARTVCFWGLVYSLFAFGYFAWTELAPSIKGLGLVLAAVSLPFLWVGTNDGSWTWRAALGVLLFVAQVTFLGWLHASQGLDASVQTPLVLMIFSAAAAALVLVLSGSRIVPPAPAALTVFMLTLGLVAVEWWLRPPRASTAAVEPGNQQGEGSPREDGDAATDDTPQTVQVEWSYSMADEDADLDYRYKPFSTQKTYYPSDPRGYFDAESFDESLDMRLWILVQKEGGKATLAPAKSANSPVTIDVLQEIKGKSYSSSVVQIARVVPGSRYVVSAKLRSPEFRPVSLQVAWTTQGRESIGISNAIVGPEWTQVSLPVIAPDGMTRAEVRLHFGEAKGQVEIASVDVFPARGLGGGLIDMRALSVQLSEGALADIGEAWIDHFKLRVHRSDAKVPWHVRLAHPARNIQSGKNLVFSFRARSEAPRSLDAALVVAEPPWTSLGFNRRVELSSEWQEFKEEFVPPAGAPFAQIQFNAGSATGWVEIEAVSLRPVDAPPDLVEPISPHDLPSRWSVIHRTNSKGYRDREHEQARPENTFRIAFIGDSLTFGQGVQTSDRFSDVVERFLNESASSSGPKFEAINFGVCGYSTSQERLCYQKEIAAYQPQLVLVMMHHNDVMTYREEQEYFKKRRSGGVLAIADRIVQATSGGLDYTRCVDELLKFRDACQANQSAFAVAAFRDSEHGEWIKMVETVQPAMASAEIPFLDLGVRLTKEKDWKDLVVHDPADTHPNEIAHRIAAEEIVRFLKESRLVPTDGSAVSRK